MYFGWFFKCYHYINKCQLFVKPLKLLLYEWSTNCNLLGYHLPLLLLLLYSNEGEKRGCCSQLFVSCDFHPCDCFYRLAAMFCQTVETCGSRFRELDSCNRFHWWQSAEYFIRSWYSLTLASLLRPFFKNLLKHFIILLLEFIVFDLRKLISMYYL